ncbi:sterol desaturase family protein [Pyxidicoccus xibeiensis]|uniref:sterol desaturase family protein n=1 Tax=Pyxidicoccus xibeiensis TaxID=2906759 RepID=UPI0020A771F6|nr:sterol desaturase family protein [Pyxidicoccus xibeiensis]MCP3136840.1 sterol desaturase family protein [Pyxidicoccus xibeiensis]
MAVSAPTSFWKNRKHNLDRMTLGDLVYSFFTYYAVVVYIALGLLCLVLAVKWYDNPVRMGLAVLVTTLAYPAGWFVAHRYVLHARFLYKSPLTSAMWKRVHFDHHQDPNDLRVLFGALGNVLPLLAIVLIPLGWLIGGRAGAVSAFGWAMVMQCFYEFCHCIQHLNYMPKNGFLKEIKRLHLSHHYHNEQGNYGITNYLWDRLCGTYYAKASDVPKSPTVFNLGYTAEEAQRYPWVDRLSGGTRGDDHPRRFWEGQNPESVQAVVEEPTPATGTDR